MPTESQPAAPKDPRRHDLDALRAFAMLLGIGLHAALSFFAVPIWVVQDKSHIAGIEPVVSAVHGFRMPLFFLISGFFTAMLWKRRGLGGLIRQRSMRVAYPLGIGCATIVPAMWMVMTWAAVHTPSGGADAAVVVADDADVWMSAFRGEADAVRVLVERGATLDEEDPEYKTTPLGWAALGGQPEVAEYLLEAGADPNLAYGDGSRPMHTAAFFGRAGVFEQLLNAGADATLTNSRGETPIDSMKPNKQITMMIAGFLKMKIDFDDVSAGRDRIQELLAEHGIAEEMGSAKSTREIVRAAVAGLIAFPFFQHLWFLWHLCLLVVGFVVAVLVTDRVPVFKRFPQVLIATPLCLLWLVPLTLTMQWFMSQRGTAPGFGPDTSAGLIPMPHVLGYYAIFFGFGAMVYSQQGGAEKLGRGWWLMLPAALAMLPVSLALGYQTEWAAELVTDEGNRRVAAALSQVLYAWLMTFGLLGLFETVLHKERAWVRYLSDSSYWLYLIHLPLIIIGQELLSGTDAPGWAKLAGLLAVTTVVLLVSYQLMVRHTPIGWLLNGTRKKPTLEKSGPAAGVPGL